MTDQTTTAPTRGRLVALTLTLALISILRGWVSARLGLHHPDQTVAWISSGIALAAFIYYGPRLWPGAFGAALVLTLAAGIAPGLALVLSVGFTLGPLAGAGLLRRTFDFRPELDRVRDVVLLLFVAGPVASTIGAVVGVTAYWLAGDLTGDEVPYSLLIWWRAAIARVVTMTPFFLLLATGAPRWSDLLRRREFWAVEILLLFFCYMAFSGVSVGELQALTTHLPLLLVVWAGARLGTRGTVVIALQIFMLAGRATRDGHGPFVMDEPTATLSLLWIYVMGVGSVGPLLAAAIAQRDRADTTKLQAERDRLLLEQRERIMREMHDGLGGQLVSVLSMVERGKASASEVSEGLRRALDDMRIMIDSLEDRAERLPSLLGKLRARLEPVLGRNGLQLAWRIEPGTRLDDITPERSLHCLRIIQEAVANVIQHARASRVEVTISPHPTEGSMVSIEVRDDGISRAPESDHRSRGMRNMIERARELGADLLVEPTNPGLRVLLMVPATRSAD